MSSAATTTALAATSPSSIRLPSIHELTGKSRQEFQNQHNKHSHHYQLGNDAFTSPRSFVDAKSQPPVLPSLGLNTSVHDTATSTFKIPPIKPMTPSSTGVNNSTSNTPTGPTQSSGVFPKPVSLGSPAIGYNHKHQAQFPRQEPLVIQTGIASTTAPLSASSASTTSSPTMHLQASHPHIHHHQQSSQTVHPPPTHQSPLEYNRGQFSPHYHQPSRAFTTPVPQYLPQQVSFYSQFHYTVQHPNNHGLQIGQPYTITEVIPKTTNKCHRCGTTETPEWRRGPKGVRTLCNACGLFHAKLVKRKGAAVAAEEVLNNRVTKGKNGRRISTRKQLGNVSNGHHRRESTINGPQGLLEHHQKTPQHYPNQFAVLQQNHSTSSLQQAHLAPNAHMYSLHHQQLPPPPNTSYHPQGYMSLPPPAMPRS
ncbi:hypothetical protein CANMA_001844 [Candida margitis]|uniref:uncharacterized protein n=1 Tax=Candida margitis TaxID=1775924 RepID=UPI002225DE4A|nr:uncharacterized protein CANMA_001844 [Candida margitis]KAI5969177.1 hypothetical protein CANMA_001844 [Candida margitis]